MTKQDEARAAFDAARAALVNASEALELAAEAAYIACKEAAEPESGIQECIDADALRYVFDYWGCVHMACEECPAAIDGKNPMNRYGVDGCEEAQTLDLLRRQRELDAKEGR